MVEKSIMKWLRLKLKEGIDKFIKDTESLENIIYNL